MSVESGCLRDVNVECWCLRDGMEEGEGPLYIQIVERGTASEEKGWLSLLQAITPDNKCMKASKPPSSETMDTITKSEKDPLE